MNIFRLFRRKRLSKSEIIKRYAKAEVIDIPLPSFDPLDCLGAISDKRKEE